MHRVKSNYLAKTSVIWPLLTYLPSWPTAPPLLKLLIVSKHSLLSLVPVHPFCSMSCSFCQGWHHVPIWQTPYSQNLSLSILSSDALISKAVADNPSQGPHQLVATYLLYTEKEGHGTVGRIKASSLEFKFWPSRPTRGE